MDYQGFFQIGRPHFHVFLDRIAELTCLRLNENAHKMVVKTKQVYNGQCLTVFAVGPWKIVKANLLNEGRLTASIGQR